MMRNLVEPGDFSRPPEIPGTDPHPGNILVTGGGQVGLIDFGQVCDPWRHSKHCSRPVDLACDVDAASHISHLFPL